MQCLRPIKLKNPRYKVLDFYYNQNFIKTSLPLDYSLLVPCGKCRNCLKNKSRDWRARLISELSSNKDGYSYFVTLTLDDSAYDYYCINSNVPVRLFLERYRKRVGRSLKHFIVTELGSETHRLHYHAIFFGSKLSSDVLSKIWDFGFSHFGWCTEDSVSYIAKYITKPQIYESWYKPKIFASPGLGKSCISKLPKRSFEYLDKYGFGFKLGSFNYSLPRYLKLKLYGEEFLRLYNYHRYYNDIHFNLYSNGIEFFSVESMLNYRDYQFVSTLKSGSSLSIPKRESLFGSLTNDDSFNF